MFAAALIAGLLCVVIWLYLLLGRGSFWRIPLPPTLAKARPVRAPSPGVILSGGGASRPKDLYSNMTAGAPSSSPAFGDRLGNHTIAVVIPARNEADVIGRVISSLLRQRGPSLSPEPGEKDGAAAFSLRIFVVDDNSTDGTAEAARRAVGEQPGRLTVISGRPLLPGWSGKLWAIQQGIERARPLEPDYILLTDADIEHASDNVASLIEIAETGGYEMASYMVKLHCLSVAEKLLIPAFVFFFFMLYPPEWIRDPGKKIAGAAGGCILIRPSALERVGGLAAIRGEIIDDCALARAVKNTGGRVWLGAAAYTHSVRPYESLGEIERMISRTAFNQLRHSFALLAGTALGMLLIYVLPLALMVSGSAKLAVIGTAALALMAAAYLPMVRFYGLNPAWAATLPFSAVFYTLATIHSAVKYWSGRGGEWKGRAQDQG